MDLDPFGQGVEPPTRVSVSVPALVTVRYPPMTGAALGAMRDHGWSILMSPAEKSCANAVQEDSIVIDAKLNTMATLLE